MEYLIAVDLEGIGGVAGVPYETLNGSKDYEVAKENAVREIQIRNGMPPTGEVDRNTWEVLARIFNFSTHYLEQN